jgi:hypothetical protein
MNIKAETVAYPVVSKNKAKHSDAFYARHMKVSASKL